MDYIVYFLGAGFSAPLGLPVMSNFLERSQDQHARHPNAYGYFRGIFDKIRDLHFSKSYYSADLSNVEEILSLLEMEAELERNTELRDAFTRYLADVIKHHTKPLAVLTPQHTDAGWSENLGLNDGLQASYARFVASLHFAQVQRTGGSAPLVTERFDNMPYRYGVITVNYDTLIETFTEYLTFGGTALRLITDPDVGDDELYAGLPMAKLHGTLGGTIVPPTWNKGFHAPVLAAWRLAYRLLSRATHIRVIGYSLPDSDAYVRYLFKSAILPKSAERLKAFHVLCRDDGGVARRYEAFTSLRAPHYVFKNLDVADYLARVAAVRQNVSQATAGARFQLLDDYHTSLFRS